MTTNNKNWKTMLVQLENKLAEFFIKKLPALPEKVKEIIVKYGPYVITLMLVYSILATLAVVGISMAATPFLFLNGLKGGFILLIIALLGILIVVLEIMAIKGLFTRQMKSWKLLFYISLIQALCTLLRLDLGGLIIGTGISWYILFQVRSYYK